MHIAFVAYDGMTALDFVGVYDPLTRLDTMGFRDVSWDVCARTERVTANAGLEIVPDVVDEPLAGYDMLVVPGGFVARELAEDDAFVSWLSTADSELVVSVCTGSLLLGAAGFLSGKRATTHPDAYDLLGVYCDTVVEERVVRDGDVVTAGGVTSGIDLGLELVEELTDSGTRETIETQMDYPYGR
ncbi:ThiJ/PfpI domain protein [Haladaptatus paucihalophilus DX253]|uniref:Cyclohexyl-isocyanide hydratase n=1 Tax=Haladaptatus paucihalophilus DX253 TaxID=797209 RepID=E7QV19_HALPU|nr:MULTISPECIES: DJ-1/PfpI family protein [Haladaptatus]EFW91537.1 ThiJ/PfpI domain protein [Haladaptatus paucihalophilus DX253]GKZ16190.1 dimethylglycine dehydrogenase [Haladaptatus sp. T7]SHL25321.1 cyclohexyl-isocyanide hydratase [Haladaptatus paucihalophilus DX253]